MKFGPKYKICKRVGDRVFGKCQNPKFEMTPPGRAGGKKRGGKKASEYGQQLTEKQKVRYTYGMAERQFANYVKHAAKARENPSEKLYEWLERRLDNVVYRSGLAQTRTQARQIVSHGHMEVNGRRVNIPSYIVEEGDVITLRKRSQESPLFSDVSERVAQSQLPAWLTFDPKKWEITIKGVPKLEMADTTFHLKSVIEFYSR